MPGIVVGIDGSPAADAALAFALEEAKLRELPLRIVCAWEVPAIEYAGAAFAPSADLAPRPSTTPTRCSRRPRRRSAPTAGIHVETVAVQGHPATVLLEQARGRDAARRRHARAAAALTRLVLGSVSQSLAHHCPKPLLIVPAPDAG